MQNRNTYFVSDIHLGYPNHAESLIREKKLVCWLNSIKDKTSELFLLGDVFDFWWEWKHVIPKGYSRFFGKICEFTDAGIPVHFFTGNHDIWAFDYLPKELGVKLHRKPLVCEIKGKKFYIAHGDGLGPYDKPYKILKWFFTNKFLQWCFSRLHPNFAIGLANAWSHKSRASHPAPKFIGEDKEWLVLYAKDLLKNKHFDYFVFGHRHLALNIKLNEKSGFVNLGDWINQFTYAEFNGKEMKLKSFN